MFTGIIQEIGKITKIKKFKKFSEFSVTSKTVIKNKVKGDSIAVNGVCITITRLNKNQFSFNAIPETLEKTNLIDLKTNSEVNLEPALTLNQAINGHLVQGHIDTIGTVENLKKEKGKVILWTNFPKSIAKYLALKGSITINGVSLTISKLESDKFSVDLIPFTLKKTNLGILKKGHKVNLEIDMIAKYLERLLNEKEKQTKYQYLMDRGFI